MLTGNDELCIFPKAKFACFENLFLLMKKNPSPFHTEQSKGRRGKWEIAAGGRCYDKTSPIRILEWKTGEFCRKNPLYRFKLQFSAEFAIWERDEDVKSIWISIHFKIAGEFSG